MSVASSRMSGATGTVVDGKDGPSAGRTSANSRRFEAFKAAVSASFMGVFTALSKKHNVSQNHTVAARAIIFIQMLAFVFSSSAGYAWSSTVLPAQVITGIFTTSGYVAWVSDSVYLIAYAVAVGYILFTSCLFFLVAHYVSTKRWSSSWPLKALRVLGGLASSVLFIPLSYLILSGFSCSEAQPSSFVGSYGCAGTTAASAVALICLVGIAPLFLALNVDTNPLSVNASAKVHGRVDLCMLLCQGVLVAVVNVWPATLSPWALAAAVFVSGLIWTAASLLMMPYYKHWMNVTQVTFACVYLWASVCLLLSEGYAGYDAAVALYLGAPLAALAGSRLAAARAERAARCAPAAAWTTYDIELRARYLLHQLLWGHATLETGVMGAYRSRSSDVETGQVGGGTTARGSRGDEPATGVGLLSDASDSALDDSGMQARAVRALLTPADVAAAAAVLATGCSLFRLSPMMHVIAARFYLFYADNKHLHTSHLLRASRLSPWLDELFFILQSRSSADDAAEAQSNRATALSRVVFEALLSDARKQVIRAMRSQSSFWAHLQSATPDMRKLHKSAEAMTTSIDSAEVAFTSLMAISSQSVAVLRMYAEFTLSVTNNVPKADLLIAEAERVEESQTKEYQRETTASVRLMAISDFDVMADNACIITVDGSPENVGTILSVNPAATRAFGYTKWQLERRNIAMLIPQPIAAMHDNMMRGFLAQGGGCVVDQTRVVFGLHRNGHVFPCLLAVREMASASGTLAFVGLIRPLSTADQHVLLDGNFRVTACSIESLGLLGIEPSALEDAKRLPSLADFIKGWNGALAASLATDAGARIYVTATAASGAGGLWVQAHLQHIFLPGRVPVSVLHWRRADGPGAEAPVTAPPTERASLATPQIEAEAGDDADSVGAVSSNQGGGSVGVDEASFGPASSRAPSVRPTQSPPLLVMGDPPAPLSVRLSTARDGVSPDTLLNDATDVPLLLPRPSIHRSAMAGSRRSIGGRAAAALADIPDESRNPLGAASSPAPGGVAMSTAGRPIASVRRSSRGAAQEPPAVIVATTVGGALAKKGENDRGSYASSHMTHGVRLQDRVRRVIAVGTGTLMPGLSILLRISVGMAILVAALSIVMSVFIYSTMERLQETYGDLTAATDAIQDMAQIARQSRGLLLCSLGYVLCSAVDEAGIRGELLRAATDLGVNHDHLFEDAAAAGIKEFFTTADTPMLSFSLNNARNNLTSTPYLETLLVAGFQLSAHAQALSVTPLAEITWLNPDLAFVTSNAEPSGGVFQAYNFSIVQTWNEVTNSGNVLVVLQVTAITIALVIIIGLAVFASIVPILVLVDREHDRYLAPFMEIPDALAARLRARTDRRLKALESAGAEDQDGVEGSDSDEDGKGGEAADNELDDAGNVDWQKVVTNMGLDVASQAAAARPTGADRSGSADVSEASAGRPDIGQSADKQRRRPLRPRLLVVKQPITSWMPLLFLNLQFALPFLMTIAFYVTMYVTTLATAEHSDKLVDAMITSIMVAQSVAQVPNFVQRTVMQHGSPSDVLPIVSECHALSDQADYWTRLFIFGAATDTFTKSSGAVISGASFGPVDGPAFQEAAFLDACSFVASFGHVDSSLVGPFSSPACHSVAAGVVSRGFVGTVVYQLSVARAVCAARGLATVLDLASGVGTTSGGAPYSIPAVLASGPVSDMFNISDNYGLPGFDGVRVAISDYGKHVVLEAQQSFVINLCAAFLAIFVSFFIAVYVPAIYRVNASVKRQRLLLLLVPAALLRYLGGLQEVCTGLLSGADASAAGVAVTGGR